MLGSGLRGFTTQLRKVMLIEHLLCVGRYGYAEMEYCSKICILTRICRYSIEGSIGQDFGHSYLKRKRWTKSKEVVNSWKE